MEKNKEKNGFLITCISCIVLLLVMFYFGVTDSLKGTQSVECHMETQCVSYGKKCTTETYQTASANSPGENCTKGEQVSGSVYLYTCTKEVCSDACVEEKDVEVCSYPSSSSNTGGNTGGGSGDTVTCAEGEYYSGQGKCSVCPAGYYCPGGTFHKSDSSRDGIYTCPTGTTSSDGASTSSSCTSPATTSCREGGTYYANPQDAISANLSYCDGKPGILTRSRSTNCYNFSCCEECSDGTECKQEFSACWQSGSTYEYGLNTSHVGWNQVDGSYCITIPEDPDNPSPSTPSGSSSTSSSKPGSSSTSSSKPSSSSNITENPQTGQIAIFVVWVVALASIIYSVWYFKKVKES